MLSALFILYLHPFSSTVYSEGTHRFLKKLIVFRFSKTSCHFFLQFEFEFKAGYINIQDFFSPMELFKVLLSPFLKNRWVKYFFCFGCFGLKLISLLFFLITLPLILIVKFGSLNCRLIDNFSNREIMAFWNYLLLFFFWSRNKQINNKAFLKIVLLHVRGLFSWYGFVVSTLIKILHAIRVQLDPMMCR